MMHTANTFSKKSFYCTKYCYVKNKIPMVYQFLFNDILLLRVLAFITIQQLTLNDKTSKRFNILFVNEQFLFTESNILKLGE